MNYIWETAKIIFSLGIVIILIFLLYYLLRDRLNFVNKAKYMEVIDAMRLGSGEVIYLVESFDKIIMIASGKEGSTKIESWEKSEINLEFERIDDNKPGKFKTNIFKDKFMQALNRTNSEPKKKKSRDNDE
ncbi:MAG: flagellar biosynthetic protein FliO [Bacillota bacterium]